MGFLSLTQYFIWFHVKTQLGDMHLGWLYVILEMYMLGSKIPVTLFYNTGFDFNTSLCFLLLLLDREKHFYKTNNKKLWDMIFALSKLIK